MRICFLLIIAFISFRCLGQNQTRFDSLKAARFDKMSRFFSEIESADLPYSEKARKSFAEVKAALQVDAKDPLFILWAKYLDSNHLDSLYSLVDSSVLSQMTESMKHQKIRSMLMPGDVFPDLALKDTSGKVVNVNGFRGKVILVNVWSSFCKPCREEVPLLKELYSQYRGSGFEIVGISLDDDRNKWLSAIAKDQQPWVQISELKPWQASLLFRKWGITGIPYNFLIGKDGRIIEKEIGISFLPAKLQKLF